LVNRNHKEIDMNNHGVRQVVRRCATVAAVVAAGFLSGWSAIGVTDGVVMGIALGAAVAMPVFRGEPGHCLSRLHRKRGSLRSTDGSD
jgi:hypothetical protein